MIKILLLEVNCFNAAFPLCQRNLSVWKELKNRPNFSFSVNLLNKRCIKLYTIIGDGSCWSVPTSFQSTFTFNRLCKYIQANSIHHMELIYVERQAGKQNGIITDGNHKYWWNVCGLTSGSSFIEENDKAIGSTSSFICTASPTIFIVTTSLLSSEDSTLVSKHDPCSALSAIVQLCKTNVFLSVMCAIWPTTLPQKKNHAGRSHFKPRICSWKISPISKSKFSSKTVHVLGLWVWHFHPIVYFCISIGHIGL